MVMEFYITLNTSDRLSGVAGDCYVQSRFNAPASGQSTYRLKAVGSSVMSSATPVDLYLRSDTFSQPQSYNSSTRTSSDIIGLFSPRVHNGALFYYYIDGKSSPSVVVSSPQFNAPFHLTITDRAGALVSVGDYSVTLVFSELDS